LNYSQVFADKVVASTSGVTWPWFHYSSHAY